jgi:hypothetical protein
MTSLAPPESTPGDPGAGPGSAEGVVLGRDVVERGTGEPVAGASPGEPAAPLESAAAVRLRWFATLWVLRVAALREANIYERQRYRHLLGLPVVLGEADGVVTVETSFAVIRTMRDGHMMVFAAGAYQDKVGRGDGPSGWLYAERLGVCDSQRVDTLLAIPL